jgi:hypothetical protein
MILSRRLIFVLLVLVIAVKAEASATKYEYEIPGLLGVHSNSVKTFNIPFDLKTTFAKIVNVELLIEGKASPGSAIATEGEQAQFELPVNFDIGIAERFIPQHFDSKTSIALFISLLSNFKTQRTFTPRRASGYSADWSFLTKGTGELRFAWGKDCPGSCRYIDHSTVDITKAILIVEGSLQLVGPGTMEQSSDSIKLLNNSNITTGELKLKSNRHATTTICKKSNCTYLQEQQ